MPFSDIISHERPKAILQAALRRDRVAHAYLFFGARSIGKRLTAMRFTQAINCEAPPGSADPDACGSCRACQQINALTHPDVLLIQPDEERATPHIKIEQIRELDPHVIYLPLVGARKICIIDQADRMTLGAANALLKTLEEPPAHSVFILISDRPAAMPATVRSRCQGVRFAAPARTEVEAALIMKRELPPDDARFLALATEGRLGEALEADPAALRAQHGEYAALTSPKSLASVPQTLTTAETLAKADRAPEALDWLARRIRDLVLARIGADGDEILDPGSLPAPRATAHHPPVEPLLDLLDAIDEYQRSSTRNLNLHLTLEMLLIRLREVLCVPDPAGGQAGPGRTRAAPSKR